MTALLKIGVRTPSPPVGRARHTLTIQPRPRGHRSASDLSPGAGTHPGSNQDGPHSAAQHHTLFIEPTSVVNTGDTAYTVDPPRPVKLTGRSITEPVCSSTRILPSTLGTRDSFLLRGSWPTP
jgi:hypothetical protein